MKKTLITLLALAGMASAGTILDADFTTGSQPEGWDTAVLKGTHTPHFTWNDNGALINGNWTVPALSTDVNLTSDEKYVITFNVYSDGRENQNVFYLSSDTYSIVIGNSYNDHAWTSVGTYDGALEGVRVSFQKSDDSTTTPTTILATSPHNATNGVQTDEGELNVHSNLSYTLTLSSGSLTVKVTDSQSTPMTWETTVDIADDFAFSSIGWVVDGQGAAVGIKDVNIAIVPEPATATLSLLALAGLAARRRRK